MKSLSSRTWLLSLAAPAAALALIAASCSQQSESPVAPSAVRGVSGGTLGQFTPNPDPIPTTEPPPEPTPPPGIPCSPGFWKNHPDDFADACPAAAALLGDEFASCDDLLEAITCNGGPKTGCTGERRQAAATALNQVSGCTESD
jgi:hypothetical protein